MQDRIFTIDEVSAYLNIPKSTVYKLSQKKTLPSSKIGKQLRFRKSSIDEWLSGKENQPGDNFPLINETTENNNESSASTENKNILVVDDDKLVLKTIVKLLHAYGYNVEVAESAQIALNKIQKTNFGLIITDIKMPGMDGIEVIKGIRELCQKANRPPIGEIIITGYADPDVERQAEELGVIDRIYKPFVVSDFINTVKGKLNSRQGVTMNA